MDGWGKEETQSLILFWLLCTDNINAGVSGASGSSVVDLVTPLSSTTE